MLERKVAGSWHAAQLQSRQGGAYALGPATYRKQGGVWVTDVTFAAALAPSVLSVASATATKTSAACTATPSGGVAPFTYQWTAVSGAGVTIDSPNAASTTFTASGLADGETRNTTFRCKVTDSLGNVANTGNVSVALSRWSQPAASLAPAGPLNLSGTAANETTGSVAASVTGGTAPFTYAWTKLSGGSIAADAPAAVNTTFTAFALAAGESRTATFRCTVTDAHGLTSTADISATIERLSQPTATVAPKNLSITDSTAAKTTAAATASVVGGTAPLSYAWTKVSGGAITITSPFASSTTFSASGLTAGESRTATFRCTVTDAHGLTSSDTVNVAIGRTAATLNATASPSTVNGSGASASVTTATSANASVSGGSGPFSYAWAKVSGGAINITNSNAASTTFGATGLTAGESRTATFRCTVTDSNGQTDATGTVSVTITNTASTGATYTPGAGTYNASDVGSVAYTVGASASVPWTWSATSMTGLTANVASGASGAGITFTLLAPLHTDRSTTITLQSGGKTWTLNLTAYAKSGTTSTTIHGGHI